MQKFILFLFALLTFGKIYAQEDDLGFLEFKGSTFHAARPFPGANILVIMDGKKVEELKSNKKGKFDIELNYGHEYTIRFSAPDYIPMFLTVSTKISKSKLPLFSTYVIDNITFYDNTDMSINALALEHPLTKVAYYPKGNDFRDDEEYLKWFAHELKDFEKASQIRNAEALKKKEAEDKRLAAELKAKKEQEEKLLAEQNKHKQEQKQENPNPIPKQKEVTVEEASVPKTYETEQQKLLLTKKAKEEQITRNKSVKQTYENDLLKTVAEETRRMRELEYLKRKGEMEVLEKIERIGNEFSLKSSSEDINKFRKEAYLKLASYHATKAVAMNKIIVTIAENSASIDEKKAKKGQYNHNRINNYRPVIINSTEEHTFKTTKKMTVKGLKGKDIFQKDTYWWGSSYYYKNDVSIDEKTYLNETSKYIK